MGFLFDSFDSHQTRLWLLKSMLWQSHKSLNMLAGTSWAVERCTALSGDPRKHLTCSHGHSTTTTAGNEKQSCALLHAAHQLDNCQTHTTKAQSAVVRSTNPRFMPCHASWAGLRATSWLERICFQHKGSREAGASPAQVQELQYKRGLMHDGVMVARTMIALTHSSPPYMAPMPLLEWDRRQNQT